MKIVKKIVEFLKKIGIIKQGIYVKTYKGSKDKNYEPDLPDEN